MCQFGKESEQTIYTLHPISLYFFFFTDIKILEFSSSVCHKNDRDFELSFNIILY